MNERKPEAIYPLSPAQQGMLMYLVLAERSEAYFEQVFCDIDGDLDAQRLRQAWLAVVARHPALRTFFLWERRERPLQVVAREIEVPFVIEDWRDKDAATQDADFAALLQADKERGFDLARPPLLRFFCARLGERRHRFLWSFSHLLIDGWSLSRLLGEALDNHQKLGRGEALDQTPSPPYSRYIDWIEKQDKSRAEAYWKESLRGLDGATALPIDRQPGAAMGSRAARFGTTRYSQADLPASLTDRIDELARSRQLPPNVVWQAAWGLLLQLYSGEEAVVYGSVVSGRPPRLPGVESIIGLFINALPISWRARPDDTFDSALAALGRQMFEQREYEYCQLEEIQRWLGLGHDQALFESLLIYENYPRQGREESSLKLAMGNMVEVTNHALVAYVLPRDSGATVRLVYDAGRFDGADVDRMLVSYRELLERMVAAPQSRIGEFSLVGPEERERLLALAAGEQREWQRRPLPELVAESAAAHPERLALEQAGSDAKLTYGELEAQASRLARQLADRGVRRGDRVVVALERSPALVVALLAVGKAGAAYLPVDPAYPAERIHFLVEDAGVRLALTQEKIKGKFPEGLELLLLDGSGEGTGDWAPAFAGVTVGQLYPNDPGLKSGAVSGELPDDPSIHESRMETGNRPTVTPAKAGAQSPVPSPDGPQLGDVAYVIYTSGSTGKPKGVEVEHAQLSHYAQDAQAAYGIAAGERLLQFASIGFDTSAEEIWPALLAGATLVLRNEEMIASPRHFLAELGRLEIALLNLPTAYWHELCAELEDGGTLPPFLRGVIIGGEAAAPARLAAWVARTHGREIALWNTYGPTETTIVATRARIESWTPADGEVPIGAPISNTRAYVVDRRGRLQPPGLPGELWIAGAGVARGYLGRPEATAAAFGADPFVPGQRLYKTGDLVLRKGDGRLYFRGRIDQQVKIRGYRVEPGEIETALLRNPRLKDAVVVPLKNGSDVRLVAYLVAADPGVEPGASTLRAALAAELPDYMVPAAYVYLPFLPKTPSGKIDRRALPAPEKAAAHLEREYSAPQTPVEELLAAVWSELLNLPEVSRDDDFFQLGGHSLLVGRLTSRLRKSLKVELPLVAVFENPRLEQLAAKVQTLLQEAGAGEGPALEVELPPIERASRNGFLPLSYPQERVWLIHQIHPDTIAYNFQATMWFEGPLDPAVMERTLTEIVRRHEIFWTRFPAVDGGPAMVIEKPWTVELPVTDLRHLGPEGARARADELLAEAVAQPFDVGQLPLIRWSLLRLADASWTLIQVEHHFVHDGWSLSVLMREMTTLYRAFAAGEPSPLPELEIQYADFAAWQRKYISGERVGGLVDWWRHKLAGMPTVLDLPFDHPRPENASMLGESELFLLPDELYQELRRFGKDNGFTLYMTMLAAFCALLHRYTGQDDFGIGAGVANRRQQAQMNLIGMIVNSVVMRADLRGNPTFAEVVGRIRLAAIESYEHQDMPFEQLVSELRPERHVGRNPLFQAMFSFHDAAMPKLDFGPGISARGLVRSNRSAKLDLNVIVAPQAEQRVGQAAADDGRILQAPVIWEYNRELFNRETIVRMIGHFLAISRDAVRHPEKKISELSLLGPEETAALLALGSTPSGSPRGAGLAALFERQAAATPEAVAVEHHHASLTYAELDRRADQLSHFLRERGVAPGSLVGLAVPRGLDLVVGMLAIVKAGGAYVPLDPSYPAERLALMMADTAMPVVLAASALAESLPPEVPRLLIDAEEAAMDVLGLPPARPLHLGVDDDFPAYVIFTSGSTGKPKGVLVPQRAVKRLVLGTDFYQAGPDDRIAQVANASFDAVTFEIWAPLLNGGRVVVLDKEQWLSPAGLELAIEEKGITAMFLTAAYFQQVVEARPTLASRLRGLLFGGERCEPEAARKALRAGARGLMNGYGPTECTTFAVCHATHELADDAPSVPIGRPIAGTEALILDRNSQLVPQGVHGELCLGGEGLADGYHGRPALTAERFVPHPLSATPGARLYRTGDLARWLPDGTIDYLGRIDHQVKLRGFRIELGEIESVLAKLPGVAGAVALVREDRAGDKRLVAYVVPAEGAELSAAGLGEELRRQLPDFMVPAALVLLDRMPLDANGKIDRRALPAPELPAGAATLEAPAGPAETALAAIWCEVLGLPAVGATDDFFALGGHSLLATQLVSRVHAQLGVKLSLAQVFEEPTVRGLGRLIGAGQGGAAAAPAAAIAGAADLLAKAEEMDDAALDALLQSMQEG